MVDDMIGYIAGRLPLCPWLIDCIDVIFIIIIVIIIVIIIIFITIIINYRLSCNTNQHDIIKYLLNIAMPPTNDHHQHHHDNKDDDHQRRSQLPRSLWVMDCLRLVLPDSDAEALDMVQHDPEQCIA